MFGQRKKFNKVQKSIKLVGKLLIGLIVLIMTIIGVTGELEDLDIDFGNYRKEKYIELVNKPPEKPKDIDVLNGDGTTNGLNLMLINNIKTEGFIKEYLTIAAKSQKGEIGVEPSHVKVEHIIGMAMGEQGGYSKSGGILPLTCLPWDNSKHSPRWEKDTDVNLSKATKQVFDRIGIEPGTGLIRGYVSPYQQTPSYFTTIYKPSKMYGAGMSPSRRTADWTYFPDQLSGLDYELSNIKGFNSSLLSEDSKFALSSLNHNVGPGWRDQFLGTYGGSKEEGFNIITGDLRKGYEKHSKQLAAKIYEPDWAKFTATILMLEQGWYLTRTGDNPTSYQSLSHNNFRKVVTICKDLQIATDEASTRAFLDAHTKEPPNWGKCGRASTQGRLWKPTSKGNLYNIVETNGHVFSTVYMGPIYYARMLKMAGVGVDPTNPETYMNKVVEGAGKKGTWAPPTGTSWISKYNVDSTQMNDNRFKVLNLGFTRLGQPYLLGGKNWDGAMDCAFFVGTTLKKTLGVDIGTYTGTMMGYVGTKLTEIKYDDLKPGDIAIYFEGSQSVHVAFNLGKTGNGRINILHEANRRSGCCVQMNSTARSVGHQSVRYFRVNGMD